jgi:hypothetical protein
MINQLLLVDKIVINFNSKSSLALETVTLLQKDVQRTGCIFKKMSYPPNQQQEPMPYRPSNIPYNEPNANPYYNGPPTTVWSVDPRPSDFVVMPTVVPFYFLFFILFLY